MKQILSLLFLFSTFTKAQTIHNNQIIIGKVDSVYSRVLSESRSIWVYVPGSDFNSIYTPTRYPVVYLLDGDTHFASFVGMLQYESSYGNTVCPPMIVVGIPNTDRLRDLSPTHMSAYRNGPPSDDLKISGGGEQFIRFLEKELMPHIDSLYPTAPHKILIGHSLGGLTAMNILVHHPQLFNSYIAIDPSMWWDNQHLLKEAATTLQKQAYTGTSLFLGIANTMPHDMDTLKVRADTNLRTDHIRSILQTVDLLRHTNNGLRFGYSYYKGDNHMAVPFPTEYDALHFLFDFYPPSADFMEQLYDTTDKYNAVTELTNRYQNLSKKMGYTILPDEELVNSLGYSLMKSNPKKSYEFFSLNIKNYPKSLNVYDSMGDYYESQKDKTKAIEYFKKALQLREYEATRKKLEKLLKEK